MTLYRKVKNLIVSTVQLPHSPVAGTVLVDREVLQPLVDEIETHADITDDDEAQRVGLAIANLLNIGAFEIVNGEVRFNIAGGTKTYAGLARTVARVFEDPQYRVELARGTRC